MAESLVLIFPTWMYGPPAMLKGWFERVWLPGVAFEIPRGQQKRAIGLFSNIRRLTVVTTSGSPRWWLWLIRDPCRNLFARGFRVLFHAGAACAGCSCMAWTTATTNSASHS